MSLRSSPPEPPDGWESEEYHVEITYEDGTVARWTFNGDDSKIKLAEQILGPPDTIIT